MSAPTWGCFIRPMISQFYGEGSAANAESGPRLERLDHIPTGKFVGFHQVCSALEPRLALLLLMSYKAQLRLSCKDASMCWLSMVGTHSIACVELPKLLDY